MSTKRLAFLEKLVADGSRDAFHHYALALEYSSLGRVDDAVAAFTTLRDVIDAAYVPTYLMCGSLLAKAGRTADARTRLEQGIGAAQRKGDQHALSELQSALAALE